MRLSQDIAGGLAVLGLAGAVLAGLAGMPRTSYQAIAPDLFPRLCAYAMAIGGLFLVARGLLRGGEPAAMPKLRGIAAVLGAIIAFALLAPAIGYAPAGFVTLIAAGFGSPAPRPARLVIFALALTAFSVVLFTVILKLAMPALVWPPFSR